MNMNIANASNTKTMSSIDLVNVINSARRGERKKDLRHSDFMVKLAKHPGIDSPKFSGQYKDSTGRTLPCYHLPKREAELMVMSESLAVQTVVYDRITQLEMSDTQIDPYANIPPEHRALVILLCENAAIKAKQAEQDIVQAEQAESIKRIEVRQTASEDGHSFFTGLAFCAIRGVNLVMSDMQRLGKLAVAHSKEMGVPVDKVRDGRYGFVNSYHEKALEAAFSELHAGM